MSVGSGTAICLMAIAAMPAAMAVAEPLVQRGQIVGATQIVNVTATLDPAVSRSQTIKFDAAALVKPIVAALGAAGYRTAGDGDHVDLVAHVVAYDSGSYIGLAKTARMSIDFELVTADGDALRAWHAQCRQRVGFDLQSTATRNAAAVTACYDELAAAAVGGLKSVP